MCGLRMFSCEPLVVVMCLCVEPYGRREARHLSQQIIVIGCLVMRALVQCERTMLASASLLLLRHEHQILRALSRLAATRAHDLVERRFNLRVVLRLARNGNELKETRHAVSDGIRRPIEL